MGPWVVCARSSSIGEEVRGLLNGSERDLKNLKNPHINIPNTHTKRSFLEVTPPPPPPGAPEKDVAAGCQAPRGMRDSQGDSPRIRWFKVSLGGFSGEFRVQGLGG